MKFLTICFFISWLIGSCFANVEARGAQALMWYWTYVLDAQASVQAAKYGLTYTRSIAISCSATNLCTFGEFLSETLPDEADLPDFEKPVFATTSPGVDQVKALQAINSKDYTGMFDSMKLIGQNSRGMEPLLKATNEAVTNAVKVLGSGTSAFSSFTTFLSEMQRIRGAQNLAQIGPYLASKSWVVITKSIPALDGSTYEALDSAATRTATMQRSGISMSALKTKYRTDLEAYAKINKANANHVNIVKNLQKISSAIKSGSDCGI